jgi:hypothetical protein
MFNTTSIYEEVERFDNSTLDTFISQLQALRLSRMTSDKQKAEASLLKKINRSLSQSQMIQFQKLNQKRLNDEINDVEMLVLQSLVAKIEKLHVERIKYVGQLAALRNCSVKELMRDLSLNPIIYG